MKALTPVVLIIASIGIFFWYVSPAYGDIKILSAEQKKYDESLKELRDAAATRDKLVSTYYSFSEEDIERLEKLLPDKINPLTYIVDVTTFFENRKFKVSNIRMSDTSASSANSGPYGTLSVSFAISATYDEFVAFIRELEQTLKLVDIASVNFTPNEKGVYDYSVTMRTYWLK